MLVNKQTKLKDIIATPAGHDIIMKACTSMGLPGDILAKGPLSNLTLEKLNKVSMGKIGDDFIIEESLGEPLSAEVLGNLSPDVFIFNWFP